jgi:lipoprotein NlpI
MRGLIRCVMLGVAAIWGTDVSFASEQVQRLIDLCGAGANASSPPQRIDACSALMQSGGVFGQGLSWAFENRCAAYADNKQFDLAIADCNRAIEFDPTARGYADRGAAFYAGGDYDKAIADFNRAIGLNPKDALAFSNRGKALYAKGENDRAIADYTQAIQLDRAAYPYNNRGDAYLAKGDYEHAIADYDHVIELDPNNSRAYLKRGVANFYFGAAPKAVADLNRSKELDPKEPYTALWLEIVDRRGRASSRLAKTAAVIDMTKWPAPIVRLYLGQITPADVNAAAEHPNAIIKKEQICEANFYGGKLALQRGKKDDANRLFELAAADCPRSFLEYGAANAELRTLRPK